MMMIKKFAILFFFVTFMLLCGCAKQSDEISADGLQVIGIMPLEYANQFQVDYLTGGCDLITINESGRFLLVPEGKEPPADTDKDIIILHQPVENIYLAATSAMCLFDALDALGNITMSGTNADGWYIENARAAMENGAITYAGKYSAPDYEMIMSKGCSLAIESTMISHSPDVQKKLEDVGVPVWIDRSSYEPHPLGRTEWIKLYGLLVGKEEQAEKIFSEQAAYLDSIPTENTGKSVAFFYISSAGNAVVHKNGDYLTKMIKLAGGNPAFTNLGDDDETGSINFNMEQFYADAKNADVIIYNSSIDGEINTVEELLAKSSLIADFKAVKDGNVWCTSKNLFQETTEFGLMVADMYRIFTGDTNGEGQLNFLYRLN